MIYTDSIEDCFKQYLNGKIDNYRLAACLEKYGKQIIKKDVNVVVDNLDYPDIFNNVNIAFKNNKLTIDTLGIYIDTSILGKFTEKELTAVFLYELGLYELLKKHRSLKYWIVLGMSTPMLSQLFALNYTLVKYLEKKLDSNLEIVGKMIITSVIIGIAITILAHIKSIDSTGQAGTYVLKYGYQEYLKSFLKKHERPLSLYLFGAEKMIKWNQFLKKLAVDLKKLSDMIVYSEGKESTGVYCNILRYQISIFKQYGIDNYTYAKQIVREFKQNCKVLGARDIFSINKLKLAWYIVNDLEKEIEKRYV